ncbi:MAG TPA: GNAT family N-acetyltransferase [Fimbriimonadaceae bacterium]|nr:GNAT family N-acetyltransferase [Fimbriimonadaceae bacterium]
MNIEIRPYLDQDRDSFTEVLSLVYRSGEQVPAGEPVGDPGETAYVALLNGEVVGGFFVRDMFCTRGEASLRAGGIGGVAIRPDARQYGVAGEMMRWGIQRMSEEGFAVSHLYAFRESFYRKFGWEVAGKRIKINCPQGRLPVLRDGLRARLLPPDGWPEVEPVYLAFARRYSGLNLRSAFQWKQVAQGTGGKTRVYAIGEPPEAYAVVHVQGAFWEEQMVSEVAWASPRGYEGLLSFIGSLASNKTAMSWYEPSNSPFLASYVDQAVSFTLARPVMYRAIHVPAALEALAPVAGVAGEFTFQVEDEVAPENRGPWRVNFGNGAVSVEPASLGDLRLDIRRFSQALLGEPSLLELAAQGTVQGSVQGLAEAAKLLTPRPTYCMDFF